MKIYGVFTDVHSNIAALDALLDHFNDRGVTDFICCGDIIGIGPRPEECARRLMSLDNLICVAGNHEGYLADGTLPPRFMDESEKPHHPWQHLQLTDETKEWLCSLPGQIPFDCEGMQVAVRHYPAPSENFVSNFPDVTKNHFADFPRPPRISDAATMGAMFRESGIFGDVILYGHDHPANVTYKKGTLCINPGALGCPHAGLRGALGGILTVSEYGAAFEPVEIPYDIEAVMDDIICLNVPDLDRVLNIFYGRNSKRETER